MCRRQELGILSTDLHVLKHLFSSTFEETERSMLEQLNAYTGANQSWKRLDGVCVACGVHVGMVTVRGVACESG